MIGNLAHKIKQLFVILAVGLFIAISGAHSSPINVLPLTLNGVNGLNNHNIGELNLYKFSLQKVQPQLNYKLIINNEAHTFTFPSELSNQNIDLFIPIEETGNNHHYTLYSNDNIIDEGTIPVLIDGEVDRIMRKNLNYGVNQLRLEPIPTENKNFADYLLKIKIKINNNGYWINPDDPDYGWLYDRIFYLFYTQGLSKELVTNQDINEIIIVKIEDTKEGRIIRLYSKQSAPIQIRALLESYKTIDTSTQLIYSNFSDPITIKPSTNDNEETLLQPQVIVSAPILMRFHNNCLDNTDFINSKITIRYTISNNVHLTLNSIEEGNVDSHLQQQELFTPLIMKNKTIQLGVIKVNVNKNNLNTDTKLLSLNVILNKKNGEKNEMYLPILYQKDQFYSESSENPVIKTIPNNQKNSKDNKNHPAIQLIWDCQTTISKVQT